MWLFCISSTYFYSRGLKSSLLSQKYSISVCLKYDILKMTLFKILNILPLQCSIRLSLSVLGFLLTALNQCTSCTQGLCLLYISFIIKSYVRNDAHSFTNHWRSLDPRYCYIWYNLGLLLVLKAYKASWILQHLLYIFTIWSGLDQGFLSENIRGDIYAAGHLTQANFPLNAHSESLLPGDN